MVASAWDRAGKNPEAIDHVGDHDRKDAKHDEREPVQERPERLKMEFPRVLLAISL